MRTEMLTGIKNSNRRVNNMCDKIVRKYCGDFVFIDIPKTATSSILTAIQTHCTNADKIMASNAERRHKPLHVRIQDGSAPEGIFRFSVVRNPYDRFVSEWHYTNKCAHYTNKCANNTQIKPSQRHNVACKRYIEQTPDFKTHVQNVKRWTENDYINFKELKRSGSPAPPMGWTSRRQYSPNSPTVIKTMTNMLTTRDEPQLPAVDTVLRFERLSVDWKQLCQKLGIEHVELPFKNVSLDREAKWSAYYDAESYAVINDVYADDFRIFNYTIITE